MDTDSSLLRDTPFYSDKPLSSDQTPPPLKRWGELHTHNWPLPEGVEIEAAIVLVMSWLPRF